MSPRTQTRLYLGIGGYMLGLTAIIDSDTARIALFMLGLFVLMAGDRALKHLRDPDDVDLAAEHQD